MMDPYVIMCGAIVAATVVFVGVVVAHWSLERRHER